jgi:hypothetical protein
VYFVSEPVLHRVASASVAAFQRQWPVFVLHFKLNEYKLKAVTDEVGTQGRYPIRVVTWDGLGYIALNRP